MNYFLYSIKDPKIGNYSFTDVKNNFTIAIREYSITYRSLNPGENKSLEELLKLNSIDDKSYKLFIKSVKEFLKMQGDSHLSSSEKKSIIEKQISMFITQATKYNVLERTQKDRKHIHEMLKRITNDSTKNNYLESIIITMEEAEINQIDNNKYLVIDKLFNFYKDSITYADSTNFSETRKYLRKMDSLEKKENYIKKKVKEILEGNEPEEAIKYIRWFFFYLIYGFNKIDIYMIHLILGYKYKKGVDFYHKLFCKDKSAGHNDDFSLDYDYSNITMEQLVNETEREHYLIYSEENLASAKDEINKNEEYISYDIGSHPSTDKDVIYIYTTKYKFDKAIYGDIAKII